MERKYKYLVKAIAKMPKHDMGNGYYVQVSYDTSDDTVQKKFSVTVITVTKRCCTTSFIPSIGTRNLSAKNACIKALKTAL